MSDSATASCEGQLRFGIIYPLVVTALAQVLFHDKANGQLLVRNGKVVGSRIIGQPFTSDAYLHSRPSNPGNGYDARTPVHRISALRTML